MLGLPILSDHDQRRIQAQYVWEWWLLTSHRLYKDLSVADVAFQVIKHFFKRKVSSWKFAGNMHSNQVKSNIVMTALLFWYETNHKETIHSFCLFWAVVFYLQLSEYSFCLMNFWILRLRNKIICNL